MVAAALPALRDAAARTRRCWWGRPHRSGARAACSGRATSCAGGCASTSDFHPTPDEPGCRGFRGFDVDGYAHHPYGPTSKTPEHADIVSMLVIRRLGRYLDRAAAAGRLPRSAADLQHRVRPPVEPSRSDGQAQPRGAGGAPEREGGAVVPLPARAQLRAVPALRRPCRAKAPRRRRSGRASRPACVSPTARRSPSYDAYRLPIVVQRARGGGVLVWGRVRPGSGVRRAELHARWARGATHGDQRRRVLRGAPGRQTSLLPLHRRTTRTASGSDEPHRAPDHRHAVAGLSAYRPSPGRLVGAYSHRKSVVGCSR